MLGCLCFLYIDFGCVCADVVQNVGDDIPPGISISWLNSYLCSSHKQNYTSVCKKGFFFGGKVEQL